MLAASFWAAEIVEALGWHWFEVAFGTTLLFFAKPTASVVGWCGGGYGQFSLGLEALRAARWKTPGFFVSRRAGGCQPKNPKPQSLDWTPNNGCMRLARTKDVPYSPLLGQLCG